MSWRLLHSRRIRLVAGAWFSVVAIGLAVAHSASGAESADGGDGECSDAEHRADILQRGGKLREARAEFESCSESTCAGPVREECVKRVAAVEELMPTVVLGAKDADGNDLGGVQVTVDGISMSNAADGMPHEIDPGEHRLVFEAQGFAPLEKIWVIMEGEKGRRERVVLLSRASRRIDVEPSVKAATSQAPSLATHPISIASPAPVQPLPFWKSSWFWGAVGAAAVVGCGIYFASGQDSSGDRIHLQLQVPH